MRIFLAEEIAQILRVPKGRVYELARQGKLPVLRIGRQVRFREESLDVWLAGLEGERTLASDVGASMGYENRRRA
jgi:excisionase family DNA binding protein